LIPRNVDILGSKCFSYCSSLSSITFESNSHLTRIESSAFMHYHLNQPWFQGMLKFLDRNVFLL
jgi:hypothetical protein